MNHLARKKIGLLVAGLGLVLLLSFHSGTTLAAQPEGEGATTQIVRSTVNFTIPADTCAELPAGVSLSGTGKSYKVIATKTKPDGSKTIVYNDFVIGTATDSAAGTYDFIYTNQNRNQVSANGSHIKVNMTDTFVLTGNGGVNNYTVLFHWTWTYSPPEVEWPPVHNWNQHVTQGDPLTCDPL